MATNFEPHECIIFVQSTIIGTHENKAIHSILDMNDLEKYGQGHEVSLSKRMN